jgi:hypothetical protein
MHHAPLFTFDADDADHLRINTRCPACGDEAVTLRVPTAHLRALTLALVAACAVLGLDLTTDTAMVSTFVTVEDRRAAEARYAEYFRAADADTDEDEDE